jgi:diguanylate cyclase (GGDEF)-like protein
VQGGEVRGCHVIAFDVTAERSLARLMEQRALTDELTSLPNRAAWMQTLQRTVAHAGRADESVAMLFIDLDGFKGINDRHGHAAGDQVLVEFARHLRGATREGDFCARLAGDEFVAMLHGRGDLAAAASQLVTRLRDALACGTDIEGAHVPLSASIGIAVQSARQLDARALVKSADGAMYIDKARHVARR